jgi:large conductance mechanosensitive channel
MRKFFKEFKEFISRGNIIDMAIAFVISTAFSAIVTALVNKVIMPLIAAIFGKVDVTELSFTLNNSIIPIGEFIQAIINFLIIALFLFLVVKAINRTRDLANKEKAKKVTKEEKFEIKALGTVDMKNRKAVYAAAVELRAKKKAEAEAEKARLAAEAETTENLLKQIRDLLANNQTKAEAETSEKPTSKVKK